jgi:hypothetical protein
MKGTSGGGTGSCDIAAVLGNFWFHQYNMEHALHLGTGLYSRAHPAHTAIPLYAKLQVKSI